MTLDYNFKSKSLLVIAPHFRVFIKDQTLLSSHYFKNTTVLMPKPTFSELASKSHLSSSKFNFLKLTLDSTSNTEESYSIRSPNFFTLPINQLRQRNCYLAANSCLKSLSKRSAQFDLMHAHFLDYGFIATKLKQKYNVPFVVTAHGGDVYDTPFKSSWYRNLAQYVLSEASEVVTVSRFNEQKLISLGCPQTKLHVIPNGYDENLFFASSQTDARKKLGLPFDKKIVLTVGNLVDIKGHVYLIDAMAKALKQRSDVLLVIVGSGPLRSLLERKASSLQISSKVLFFGQKNHASIPTFMNACDMFVLPSLGEGFPTVIPEALACGKPVVASNVGGISEALSSCKVGILVPPQDSTALSEAVLFGLSSIWNTSEILSHAQKYSWAIITKKILTLYQDTLNKTVHVS